ncbi:MAG: hypothetical protein ACLFUJ_00345 [Phycisphaerae bacterium]
MANARKIIPRIWLMLMVLLLLLLANEVAFRAVTSRQGGRALGTTPDAEDGFYLIGDQGKTTVDRRTWQGNLTHCLVAAVGRVLMILTFFGIVALSLTDMYVLRVEREDVGRNLQGLKILYVVLGAFWLLIAWSSMTNTIGKYQESRSAAEAWQGQTDPE